jgi:hypothetical protein
MQRIDHPRRQPTPAPDGNWFPNVAPELLTRTR